MTPRTYTWLISAWQQATLIHILSSTSPRSSFTNFQATTCSPRIANVGARVALVGTTSNQPFTYWYIYWARNACPGSASPTLAHPSLKNKSRIESNAPWFRLFLNGLHQRWNDVWWRFLSWSLLIDLLTKSCCQLYTTAFWATLKRRRNKWAARSSMGSTSTARTPSVTTSLNGIGATRKTKSTISELLWIKAHKG